MRRAVPLPFVAALLERDPESVWFDVPHSWCPETAGSFRLSSWGRSCARAALDPALIADAVRRAMATIRAGQQALPERQKALKRQLADAERRLGHLVEAIATGKATEAVYCELEKAEATKKTLQAQLQGLDAVEQLHAVDPPVLAQRLQARAHDLTALLGQSVPQTRQVLKLLIPGRIVCTPFSDTRGMGYDVSATGIYAPVCEAGNFSGGGHGS